MYQKLDANCGGARRAADAAVVVVTARGAREGEGHVNNGPKALQCSLQITLGDVIPSQHGTWC